MATTIDKNLLKLLREDINAALKAVGEKRGVKLTAENAKFLPTSATFKLEVETISENGVAITREMSDLRQPYIMKMYGLTEAHLTQTFVSGGRKFVLSGYRVKASKNPFLAKCFNDGKNYIFPEEAIQRLLGLKESSFALRDEGVDLSRNGD